MAAAAQTRLPLPLPAAAERATAHQVRPQKRWTKAQTTAAGRTGRPAEGGALVTTRISESLSEATPRKAPVVQGPNEGPGRAKKRPGPKKTLRYIDACAAQSWHLHVTRYDPKTGRVHELRVPYTCRSWRHDGKCRRWAAAQNFARVRQALMPLKAKTVVYMVFTLDPKRARAAGGATTAQEAWASENRYAAFKLLMKKWRSLRKAITRHFGTNRYIATVEVHRSGWPHINVVMECEPLAANIKKPNSGWTFEWLKRHAVKCGFGWRCSIERARDRAALAGYVVKIAGDVEQAAQRDATGRLVGEVVKISQVPEDAPSHFRRIRASVRFLPKSFKVANKDPNVTGELVREPMPQKEPKRAPTRKRVVRVADIWPRNPAPSKRAIDLKHPSEIWDP